jgi:hypothetical protein
VTTCSCVGTINQHPKEWIVVGLFYPPLTEEPTEQQQALF